MLIISALDYAESQGRRLDFYKLRSVVSVWEKGDNLENTVFDIKDILAKKAEALGAVAVTDLNYSITSDGGFEYSVYMSGTALIPRK